MKTKPLTPNMVRWLRRVYNGRDPMDDYSGRSASGGAGGVLQGLRTRGMVDRDGKLTAAGLLEIGKDK